MTFTENLESAKNGNKRSYGMLCNDYADKLYSVAFLVLDTPEDAEEAVKNAFEDGFRGINRINDGNHLCAWLSRELTKHIVAKLKEYRAENRTVSGGSIPEKEAFCRLNDLDRLVCALSLAFGYKTKEISVITGLKEETAERKLNDSAKKLGKNMPLVTAYFEAAKAPDSLITKAPRVHDLTVEIDHSDNDDMISEMERIAAFAEAEEYGLNPPQQEEKPKNSAKLIRFQPMNSEEDEDMTSAPEPIIAEKPTEIELKAPEKEAEPINEAPAQEEKPEISAVPSVKEEKFPKIEFIPPEKLSEPVKEEENTPEITIEEPEPVAEKPLEEPAAEAVKTEEPVQSSQEPKAKEIDAKTFINVITAQRIKGSDFLKLMGNTRISNSVYREIEQNPDLTKERLVELLEQSPLTSEDYYKILTAVKKRNEMLSKKEEAQRKQEQAGLFSINKKDETPKTPVEAPMTDTRAFAANDFEAVKSVAEEKPEAPAHIPEVKKPVEEPPKQRLEPKSADEEKPFTPKVRVRVDNEPDDGEDEKINPFSEARKPVPAPEKKAVVLTDEPETGRREKYKGREYFIDDDVYYPGVNNGKIIFAAVCAVLLIVGSFGVRYLLTGNPMPSDNPLPVINHTEEEKLPAEYLSNDDIYTAISKLETAVTRTETGYYRADETAYSELITKDFAESGDYVYLYNKGKILVYNLNSENPSEYKEFAVDESREFLGFSAMGEKIYLFYADSYEESIPYTVTKTAEDGTTSAEELSTDIKRSRVTAECYDTDFNSLYTYSQDGDFVNVRITDEALSLATALNTANGAVSGASGSYLPSYTFGEEKAYVNFDAITVPDGISYNGFTVIGTVSGNEARVNAILGGQNGYVDFEGEKCTVIIPDKNKTFSETFRFVGSKLTPEASAVYTGECYGTEFINETGNVITAYDSVNKCTLVQKKVGEEFVTVSGIGPSEALKGTAYTDKYAYIVTETAEKRAILYCVNISGAELTAAEADPNAVYDRKLRAYGDSLLGLNVEVDQGSERTGLRLGVYDYEDGLKEKRSVRITMDENTAPEYIRYLSADAEISNLRIAADETNSYIAMSTVYFDGISEIERMLCFKDDGTELTATTDLLLFDIQSDYRHLTFRGNILYIITDSSVITVNPETGEPLGYFNEAAEEEAEIE